MKTTVIGVGHVGLVTAACLARWGHECVGLDQDEARIAMLQAGRMPFFEDGMAELVAEGVDAGRLSFTAEIEEAIDASEVVFVCVGTPPLPGGGPNLAYVEAVGRDVAAHANSDLVLVEKSTVPANTGFRLAQVIGREQDRHGVKVRIEVASNPEFLREGTAVEDTLHPDRIVYGTSSDWARDRLREVYATVVSEDDCAVVETDVATAELIKHASNAMLATRISFINQVARICERVGADVEVVAEGMGHDARIGPRFLRAGIGYGGSCFPKDVDAFIHLAREVGEDFRILEEVRVVNESMRDLALEKLRGELWHLDQKVVTILGAAFKPGTDDLREAPGLHLAEQLASEGAQIRIWDPIALDAVKEEHPGFEVVADLRDAIADAHAVIVATEWPELAELTAEELMSTMAYPILIDGRNVFDPKAMTDAGIHYHSVGRG